jgi:hypothetical protein
MGYPRHLPSDHRFVLQGLCYVGSASVFMGIVVASVVILGARVTESRVLSLGVARIALLFLAVGISLLASLPLRRRRSRPKISGSGRAQRPRDLWDDQLDR